MSTQTAATRTFTTALGDLTTERVPMRELKVGDRIVQYVGEANAPYGHDVDEVTADCASNQAGWLWVRTLSMTDEQAADLIAQGAVEDGCDPRLGFFCYPLDTLLNRVI